MGRTSASVLEILRNANAFVGNFGSAVSTLQGELWKSSYF